MSSIARGIVTPRMRFLAAALLCAACGIPERVHTQTVLDLEKCSQDLANSRTDLAIAQSDVETERAKRSAGTDHPTSEDPTATKAEIENVRRMRDAQARRKSQEQRLGENLKPLVDAKTVSIDAASGIMAVRLSPGALFDTGKSDLKADARPVVLALANALKDIDDRDFLIVGHSDAAPLPSGSKFKSNWEFSTARAIAVVQALQREGVNPKHLGALGRSEFEGGAARIEVLLMPAPSELP
jgi:flagellar motor protein MotB